MKAGVSAVASQQQQCGSFPHRRRAEEVYAVAFFANVDAHVLEVGDLERGRADLDLGIPEAPPREDHLNLPT